VGFCAVCTCSWIPIVFEKHSLVTSLWGLENHNLCAIQRDSHQGSQLYKAYKLILHYYYYYYCYVASASCCVRFWR
jgi:hypothetical protein